jgi:hypothetical protein
MVVVVLIAMVVVVVVVVVAWEGESYTSSECDFCHRGVLPKCPRISN